MVEELDVIATQDRPWRAVAMILTGMTFLTINDAIMKVLAVNHPPGQMIFVRGLFALGTIALLTSLFGKRRAWRWRSFGGQTLNAVLTAIPLFIFVSALAHLPFATAITISYTSPLFVAALAPMILGEPVGWRRGGAVLLGFVGVALVAQPARNGFDWMELLPAAAVLFSAFLSGGRDLLTRHLIRHESSVSLLVFSTIVVTVLGLGTMPFGWPAVTWHALMLMAATGAIFAFSMFLIIDSFRWASASVIAPLRYTGVLWGALLGYFVWADIPNGYTVTGAILVVVSGLGVVGRGRHSWTDATASNPAEANSNAKPP